MEDIKHILREHKPVIVVIVDTKKTKEESKPLLSQLRFNKMVVVDSRGYSGGIWFLWDDELVALEGHVTSLWAKHAIITLKPHMAPWLILGVYASPRNSKKKELLFEVTFVGHDCAHI